MIRVIVNGACGRMGQMITKLICSDKDLQLAGAVENSSSEYISQDIGYMISGKSLGIIVQKDLAEVIDKGDVIIEFTSPSATIKHAETAVKYNKPMVIGTTGYSKEELDKLKNLAVNIPCVISPNMSIGMNVLFKLARQAAQFLKDNYDIEIVEAHHSKKKDAPSGSAMKLAEIIANVKGINNEKFLYGRRGNVGEREKNTIGIHAVRGGDIIGEHDVIFAGANEKLELKHQVYSRETFAKGSLIAAKFAMKAKKGIYSMEDVIGL